MIRLLAALIVAAMLTACSNTNEDLNEIKRVIAPGKVAPPARANALIKANVPRLVVSFVETDLQGIVLLEATRDGRDIWLSAENANLVTDQGMLVGTRGFGIGLMSADVSQSQALILSGRNGDADRFHSYLTGNDETVTRTYRCRVENRGASEATISGTFVPARLMAEECRSLDQSFTNLYWVSDAENKIVMTRQWTGDFLGILTTRTVLRR